ncbi:MAG: ABC transporter substrate-binding protein [Proteobacteria bacterium]|nr:ABC transporter substrate-binding protein [Pseudomonadota bacterium]
MRSFKQLLASSAVVLALATSAHAEIRVGFVTSLSGVASSIGIPYGKGINAAYEFRSEVNGEKIKLIQLDDGSDPSAATRNARKLIEEDKVDVLIGTATVPSTMAMAAVAKELKVPFIALSPVQPNAVLPAGSEQWIITVPQPPTLLVSVIADRIARDGVKNLGYIGYSDAWGDLVYGGAMAAQTKGLFKVTSNERFARTDTSVTGQILKVMSNKPDGVLIGASGTQGALPPLTLRERGYQGKIYGTVPLVNPDFVRVGGKAVEGIQVSTGPIVVAEQLPDDHFAKKIGLKFRAAYEKANGAKTTDVFSAYSFDGWLLMTNAAEHVLKGTKPGSPEFRKAMMDALMNTKDLAGTHAIYNFKPGAVYGVDNRSLVIVKLVNGKWTYAP